MADISGFGVTPAGFRLKGLDQIIADQQGRARLMFGEDVDLTSGSALRKVLDTVAWQGQELWRSMEGQYYANFVTTAQGESLNLLGTDLGLPRLNQPATGGVVLSLTNGQPKRTYVLPEGTIIERTLLPHTRFRTLAPVSLSDSQTTATVKVEAMERGPAGNIAVNDQLQINAAYAALSLNLGLASVTPTNPAALAGGDFIEPDDEYRLRLLGVPRTIWTVDSVLLAITQINGVRDAAVFDPLGGVDVSQSYFNMFFFSERAFSLERVLGSPYYFDVVIATKPGYPWTTITKNAITIPGVYDQALEALRKVRPVSIFPNIVEANQVEIGLRATILVPGGSDKDAVLAQIIDTIHGRVNKLGLGRAVLYSDIMSLARTSPGVADVQNLHLRRCPPGFAGLNFAKAAFGQTVEAGIGENLDLAPDEIAYFAIDSKLIDVEVASA